MYSPLSNGKIVYEYTWDKYAKPSVIDDKTVVWSIAKT